GPAAGRRGGWIAATVVFAVGLAAFTIRGSRIRQSGELHPADSRTDLRPRTRRTVSVTVGCFTDGHGRAALAACPGLTPGAESSMHPCVSPAARRLPFAGAGREGRVR